MKVDFNQGLGARLITDEVAEKLAQMRLLCVRLPYDHKALKIMVYGIMRAFTLAYYMVKCLYQPGFFLT
ncbi:MAG: hypothetical protein DRJ69_02695 [Thermoprotei archaeon]|nr:MAG: hypothetical protein DRJ69_02695 [Thermoprotei archaeon]